MIFKKSRKLWFPDFFAILQKEFLVTYLRYLINQDYQYKKKYINICEFKKADIKRFGMRNDTRTIFDDVAIWKRYVELIIGHQYGLPKFIYTDEKQKDNLYKWDAGFYFFENTKVQVAGQDALILHNDVENQILLLLIGDKSESYHYDAVIGKGEEYFKMDSEQLEVIKYMNMNMMLNPS